MQLSNKDIAAELVREAGYSADDGVKRMVLRIGTFTITCRDTRQHILAIADKYRTAKPFGTKQKRDWGVAPRSRLNKKTVSTRYASDWDRHEFYALIDNTNKAPL